MSKAFVLVHGAWHGGWCWRRVADVLEKQGHKVFTPTLTGLADRSHLLAPGVGLDTHVTDVVNLLKWEQLSDVVLCGHSYGGMIITGVAEKMQPAIRSIVYLDAFVPLNGESVFDLTGPAVHKALREAQEKNLIAVPPRSAEAFGVNEADRAWVDSQCTPQPIATFTEKLAVSGAHERIGKKTYIRAASYPSPGFDAALARVKTDPSWRTYAAPCGHDVMIDAPEWLAKVLIEVA
jgi:pimeloyl-ACP methyl ester carboxylesterase